MAICFNCKKGTVKGASHTHHRGVAGGRWRKRAPHTVRSFFANLQRVTIMIGKTEKKVNVCTKCLKRIKKDLTEGILPSLNVKKNLKKEVKKKS